jgi:phosphoribosylamine--glycine ligase
MKVLLIGSGGREHALAWKLAQSPLLTKLVAAPGSAAIAELCETRNVGATDVPGLVALARELRPDLVVIGPDASVEAGVADAMAAEAIPCFGPTAAAGRLESSKAFTKDFCHRHKLPTAAYGVFEAVGPAKAFLDRFQPPYVVKADGLALGKGVVVAATRQEAETAIDEMLGGRFGQAGARVVIEEFLEGEEASLFALCDGQTAVLFGVAQDHKRAYDGDAGPNTGGMGTYSPAPVASDAVIERARVKLIEPTVAGMAGEGAPYTGVLFAGLMIHEGEPRLVEYNARFGDPECQVLMLRLKSDLLPYLAAAARGDLKSMPPLEWRKEAAICVVLAAKGYPDNPEKGSVIKGVESAAGEGVTIFHAGTARREDGALVAAGGRVLNVCALGRDLGEARERAYAAIDRIDWPGGFHRTDIGWRAL